MSSNQQLVDRLYALSLHGDLLDAEFVRLDALVYGRLLKTYAEDDALEASIAASASPVELSAMAA